MNSQTMNTFVKLIEGFSMTLMSKVRIPNESQGNNARWMDLGNKVRGQTSQDRTLINIRGGWGVGGITSYKDL